MTKEISDFLNEMTNFYHTGLKWGIPVGLAAPQVGRSLRIFIAFGVGYINPEIIWKTKAPSDIKLEGCYSCQDNFFGYKVERSPSIRLRWQDGFGKVHEQRFNGYEAQVLQHEMDHLQGICVADSKIV